ncbi:MAG: hypothetical protein EPO32_04135 [Anaerolineae bacterium]|nr:MAG: hypothetical protein EPO32_04135 [Anaerolineae bacterium]
MGGKSKRRFAILWAMLVCAMGLAVIYFLLPQPRPCGPEIYVAGADFENPYENVDEASQTTFMAFDFAGEALTEDDQYTWYWNTRPFGAVDSNNKGSGVCQTIPTNNQVLCPGLPHANMEGLDGYEYEIALVNDVESCGELIYEQKGLIYFDTGEHTDIRLEMMFEP